MAPLISSVNNKFCGTPDDSIKGFENNLWDENLLFGGCIKSNCYTPMYLINLNDFYWHRQDLTVKKNDTWLFWWKEEVDSTLSTNQFMTGVLMLDIESVQDLFAENYPTNVYDPDFSNNGYTIIITLNKEMSGMFFTPNGDNFSTANDGETFGKGKTISFTSREYYQDILERDTSTVSKPYKKRAFFPITFYSQGHGQTGEYLPANLNIAQVRLLEGEFSNVECLVSNDYDAFSVVDDSSTTGYKTYSPHDISASTEFRKFGKYDLNAVNEIVNNCVSQNNNDSPAACSPGYHENTSTNTCDANICLCQGGTAATAYAGTCLKHGEYNCEISSDRCDENFSEVTNTCNDGSVLSKKDLGIGEGLSVIYHYGGSGTELSRSDAIDACKNKGLRLARFYSQEEFDMIEHYAGTTIFNNLWTGHVAVEMTADASPTINHYWSDNNGDINPNDPCDSGINSISHNFRNDQVPLSNYEFSLKEYMCEDRHELTYTSYPELVEFKDAVMKCISAGKKLARIYSSVENTKFLEKHSELMTSLGRPSNGNDMGAWFALKKDGDSWEHDWYFVDYMSEDLGSSDHWNAGGNFELYDRNRKFFNYWANGEPSGDGICGSFHWIDGKYQWNDRRCFYSDGSYKLPYICEDRS